MKLLRLSITICLITCALQVVGGASPAQAATRYEAGIATSGSLVGMDRGKLQSRLDDIKNLGTTWIRVDFSWPTIQPTSADEFDWSGYDYLVEQASVRDLKILAVLAYTPQWAQDPRCTALVPNKSAAKKCNPRSAADFARFAGVTAERYRHYRIRGYEIWNEPNLLSYWRTAQSSEALSVDPRKYAELANAAAVEIRKHNVDCVILPGGLAPLFEPQPSRGMRQSDFAAALIPHLRADLFTGIAVHPYSWPALPETKAAYNAFYTVDDGDPAYSLREVMRQAGWHDKEIWGTEFGASTKGQRAGNATRYWRPDHVTEQRQAEIVTNGMQRWYQKENVGPLFVHSDNDAWLGQRKNESGFGLRRNDGSEKPAYQSFKDAADTINKADTVNAP
jgi:hypothetical protein